MSFDYWIRGLDEYDVALFRKVYGRLEVAYKELKIQEDNITQDSQS